MENIVLKTEHLTKAYKKHNVLENFSVELEKGHIYGLIGPNGAGKTTLLKLIAGLTQPTTGSITLFGNGENLNAERSRMGFLVEAPFLDDNMTAYENLYLQRLIKGVADINRIPEVLEMVGLSDTGKKKVKNFSLGMRQRLGIAMALLSNPEILVLDEPVNGLDPEGMIHIRNLLLNLCSQEGMTILISSHLLSELHLLATDYILLKNGKMQMQLSAEELEAHSRSYLEIKINDSAKATVVLERDLNLTDYKVQKNGDIYLYEGIDCAGKITEALFTAGLTVSDFHVVHENLEDYYISVMGQVTEEETDATDKKPSKKKKK